MNNTFDFIGTISMGKESDKFKPYEEKDYPTSGWTNRDLKFNVVCGDNRHMLEIRGGCFKDGHGDVMTWSKATQDKDGNRSSGEKLTIPFSQRFDPDKIAQVAEFKKFVVDLEEPKKRYELTQAIEHFKDNTITDEELTKLGCTTLAELEKALEQSNKKRKEFLTEYDFADFVHKLIMSDKVKDKNLHIIGNIDIQPDDREGHDGFYRHYLPTRMYLSDKDTPVKSEGQFELYYNKDSFDDKSVDEKGKYFVHAYTFNYNSNRKANVPCPVLVSINAKNNPNNADDMTEKLAKVLKKQFTVNPQDKGMWKQVGVKVDLLEGAQKKEITEDMLSDNEEDMLDVGLITLDDIRKELGGNIYGERISEDVVIGFARGYLRGAKTTVYKDSDFVLKPLEVDNTMKEVKDADPEDIFSDIDL